MRKPTGACSTCRSRKVKCDRILPKCSPCRRLRLDCVQQQPRSSFVWTAPVLSTGKSVGKEINGGEPEVEHGARRQALFSNDERIAECLRIVGEVPDDQVDHVLSQLDSQSCLAGAEDALQVGPFGMFSSRDSVISSTQKTPGIAGNSSNNTEPSLENQAVTPIISNETQTSPETWSSGIDPSSIRRNSLGTLLSQEISGLFDDPIMDFLNISTPHKTFDKVLAQNSLPAWDFSSGSLDSSSSSCSASSSVDPLETALEPVETLPPHEEAWNSPFFALTSPQSSHSLTIISPLDSMFPQMHVATDIGDLSTNTMRFLMDHYRSSIATRLSPLQHLQSPWKSIHLPFAMQTLGEISMHGDSGNARVALLFAILATTAFNLDSFEACPQIVRSNWKEVGENFRKRAKKRLQAALRQQSTGKMAKYKELLTALLSMVTVCVASGQMDEARCFLLDAERLIWLRGLRKSPKSRKVLMLHSLFLYLRVVEDITATDRLSFSAATSSSTDDARKPHVPGDSANSPSLASCRWPTLWTSRSRKGLILDYEDVCLLEDQLVAYPAGSKEMSAFERIFSIPESLFTLISRASHLAHARIRSSSKSRHSSGTSSSSGGGLSNTFLDQAKATETAILNWKNPYRVMAELQLSFERADAASHGETGPEPGQESGQEPGEEQTQGTGPGPGSGPGRGSAGTKGLAANPPRVESRAALLFDLIEAMHAALIIYFYREVRDISSIAMQHYVDKTVQHLLKHEQRKLETDDHSAHVCWPAFIAGCEAQSFAHRDQISSWLFRAGQRSGLRMFCTARSALLKVWDARASTADPDLPWRRVIAEQGLGLILS